MPRNPVEWFVWTMIAVLFVVLVVLCVLDEIERRKAPRSWQARILERWRREHHRGRAAGNLVLMNRVRTLADNGPRGCTGNCRQGRSCTCWHGEFMELRDLRGKAVR